MPRKNVNTTLDEDLYKQIKILAISLDLKANDLIEEGMTHILQKYSDSNRIKNKQENCSITDF